MQYQVRATKRDGGGYDLSYGRGEKKLEAVLAPHNGGWNVFGTPIQTKLKRDAIDAWGKWAAESYSGSGAGSSDAPSDTDTSSQPDSAPTPPSIGRTYPAESGRSIKDILSLLAEAMDLTGKDFEKKGDDATAQAWFRAAGAVSTFAGNNVYIAGLAPRFASRTVAKPKPSGPPPFKAAASNDPAPANPSVAGLSGDEGASCSADGGCGVHPADESSAAT